MTVYVERSVKILDDLSTRTAVADLGFLEGVTLSSSGSRMSCDGRASKAQREVGCGEGVIFLLLIGKWRVLVHSGCYFCSNLKLY